MSRRTKNARVDLPVTFDGLNQIHPLRPISDDVDLDNASEMADALVLLRRPSKDQADYLESLSILIERYEADALDFRDDDVIGILQYLMDGQEMSASDLGWLLGNRSLGAAILRGDRKLSKAHVKVLGDHFGVDPGLFLRD